MQPSGTSGLARDRVGRVVAHQVKVIVPMLVDDSLARSFAVCVATAAVPNARRLDTHLVTLVMW
jgi:hypothetical protein